MSRRVWIGLLLLLAVSVAPLRAQLVVIDPANLTQTILIAERTLRTSTTSFGRNLKSFSAWRRNLGAGSIPHPRDCDHGTRSLPMAVRAGLDPSAQ